MQDLVYLYRCDGFKVSGETKLSQENAIDINEKDMALSITRDYTVDAIISKACNTWLVVLNQLVKCHDILYFY